MNEYLSAYICKSRKRFNIQTALSYLINKSRLLTKRVIRLLFLWIFLRSLAQLKINIQLLSYIICLYWTVSLHYHSDYWQNVNIDSSFSSWSTFTQGVQLIYINNLYFALKYIEVFNFADNATLFVCDLDLIITINKLEENSAIALTCFEPNYMKLNSDKSHCLFLVTTMKKRLVTS